MTNARATALLSEVEQLVLLAVLKLGPAGNAYAVPIRALILKDAGVNLPRGSIYVTLTRLEEKGLIRSTLTEPRAVPGGKARRVFVLCPPAMVALKTAARALTRMMAGTALAKS